MNRRLMVGYVCASVLVVVHLPAQQTARVIIQSRDARGAAIAHAQVLLDCLTTTPSSETDATGSVTFNLEPGTYEVSVSAPGFKNTSQRFEFGLADRPPAERTIPVLLQVGDLKGMVVYPADSIILTNDSHDTSVTLTHPAFRALPHISIIVHNGHTNAEETYSGVPLASLLAKINAPAGNDLRGKTMTRYLIATGSDGYSVVLSLAEADPAFRDTQVIVADHRDGQPLGKNGPFQLIVPEDNDRRGGCITWYRSALSRRSSSGSEIRF